jgi:hypothetical protein
MISEEKVKRNGKLFASLDFDIDNSLTADQYYKNNEHQVVGELVIGRFKFPVTIKELEKLEQTCKDARSSLRHMYQLGLMR